jgi:Flp pilus assembly protein TadG
MRGRGQDGASAVEFALVLPLLVLFLFGTITFGLAFARAQQMEAIARESARLAAIGRTVQYSDVVAAARGAAAGTVDGNHLAVEIRNAAGAGVTSKWCKAAGDPVTVVVQIAPAFRANYRLIVPLWPGSGSLPSYQSAGTFRCEAAHS